MASSPDPHVRWTLRPPLHPAAPALLGLHTSKVHWMPSGTVSPPPQPAPSPPPLNPLFLLPVFLSAAFTSIFRASQLRAHQPWEENDPFVSLWLGFVPSSLRWQLVSHPNIPTASGARTWARALASSPDREQSSLLSLCSPIGERGDSSSDSGVLLRRGRFPPLEPPSLGRARLAGRLEG